FNETKPPKKPKDPKETFGNVLGELGQVAKPSDQNIKPSEVKKKVAEIKYKDTMGQSSTQLLYNFACELCEQYRRKEHRNFVRLDGIGLDPNKVYIVCDTCIEFGRANVIKPRNYD